MITQPAEYPIRRCNDAVMYGFGKARYFVLMDAFSGYHQIRLSPMSIPKTAFYAPRGNTAITLSTRQTKALMRTTPCRTMIQCLTTWQNFILSHTTQLLEEHEH
eukprot:4142186-Ditylum_brightwellii.AAC.1